MAVVRWLNREKHRYGAHPELDAVEPALGLEAREAGLLTSLQAPEEGLEGLVDAAQELLLGGEGEAGKAPSIPVSASSCAAVG